MSAPKYDDRMPRWLHVAVCNGLMTEMNSPADCNHTHERTTRLLEIEGVSDTEPALAWMREHGGGCDCEVILNTVPDEDEVAH